MRPDFREAVLQGRPQAGVWSNLGAVNASVIAAGLGYDWMLLDTEHGLGDEATLQAQLDNAAASATAAIVRIPELTDGFCKKALDLGAAGVMVPQVKTRDEAVRAARSMRYPPDGRRGVSRVNRATVFGLQTEAYLREANRAVLCVVQIETAEAVEAADAIAAVEGVDVLFVGPADLGYALGVPGETDHPRFREALVRV
ncbi:MAG: HpcH/HpaI aldolase family protein, partial [Planctomycetota bacterium]